MIFLPGTPPKLAPLPSQPDNQDGDGGGGTHRVQRVPVQHPMEPIINEFRGTCPGAPHQEGSAGGSARECGVQKDGHVCALGHSCLLLPTCMDQKHLEQPLVVVCRESAVSMAFAIPTVQPWQCMHSCGDIQLKNDIIVPVRLPIHLLPRARSAACESNPTPNRLTRAPGADRTCLKSTPFP